MLAVTRYIGWMRRSIELKNNPFRTIFNLFIENLMQKIESMTFSRKLGEISREIWPINDVQIVN